MKTLEKMVEMHRIKKKILLSIKCLTSLKKHGKTWCGSNGT